MDCILCSVFVVVVVEIVRVQLVEVGGAQKAEQWFMEKTATTKYVTH